MQMSKPECRSRDHTADSVFADPQPYTRRTVFIEHPDDTELLQHLVSHSQMQHGFLNGEGDVVSFDKLDFGLQCGLFTMFLNQRKSSLLDQPGRYALPPGFNAMMAWVREGEEEQHIPDSPILDGDPLSVLNGEDPALLWFDAEGDVANAQIDRLAAGDTALGKAYERLEWAQARDDDAWGWRRRMAGVEGAQASVRSRVSQGEALLRDLAEEGKSAFRTSREPREIACDEESEDPEGLFLFCRPECSAHREELGLRHWISDKWVRDQSIGSRAWRAEQRRKAREEQLRQWQRRRAESEQRNIRFREMEVQAGIRQGSQEVLGMQGADFQQLYEGPVVEEDADTPSTPGVEHDEMMF